MKSFVLIGLLSLAGIGYSQGITGSRWEVIKSQKTGTLQCLWNESYGIVYRNDKGELSGVCVDILRDFQAFIKTNYDIQLEIKFVEEKVFDNFMKVVATTPGIIGASSVTITEERRKSLQFSPTYLVNPNVLISSRDAKPLARLEDLGTTHKNFKIKIIRGSSHEFYANQIKQKYNRGLVIEFATSSREIFDDMATDPTLLTILDCAEFLGVKKTNKDIVLQKVDLRLVDEMAFIMHKRSDWGKVFQEFLTEEYRQSSRYRKIVADNLGSTYLVSMK